MKPSLFFPTLLCALAFGLLGSLSLSAQTNQGGGARLGFLSAEDRVHFLKVRQQVLDSNPDLKTEQESLEKERQFVKTQGAQASQDDRKTLRENTMAHFEKMNTAMLQADPSISSILDEIKAKMKERPEQHADSGDGANQ
jgi:DNA-binding PucR family transcriptional regulator